jgi:flagellin
MALTLNTNIDSLTAQNNLTGSQALLSQSLTRLSSGLRINSAADDAAGLAISQGFTTQINGTNQAINNANDAVSEAQTAGGALSTIVNNLQSIRTLAVEAANGSNSASDRAALNAQVQQQIAEITQIAQQTTFNGTSVLNGSSGTTVYQVGADVGDTIAVNLTQGVQANQIGQYASQTAQATTTALGTGGLTLQIGNNPAVAIQAATAGTNTIGQAADSAFAAAAAINDSGVNGLTATATTSEITTGTTSAAVTAGTGTGTSAGTYSLTINGTSVFASNPIGTSGISVSQLETAINAVSSTTGVTASTVNSEVQLTAADGSNINTVEAFNGTTGGGGFAAAGIADSASTSGFTAQGQVTLQASSAITVGGTSNNGALTGLANGVIAANTGLLSTSNVLTVSAANATIQAVDSALNTVSAFQSQLGSIQNRFTAAVSNLTSTAQNLTQSRSTIQDANFAQETANLTQAQVLEQAGISVLSQANQEPQLILKLLQ